MTITLPSVLRCIHEAVGVHKRIEENLDEKRGKS